MFDPAACRRALLAAALILGLPGCAAIRDHHDVVASGYGSSALQHKVWESPGFLRHHPDIRDRKLGLWYSEQGDLDKAVAAFRSAALYGDKSSQAMLAEMYFEGIGLPRDHATAYAWMDLAAERGYLLFLAKREQYWSALDPAAQQRALRLGGELYAEFGDQVAKPRMEKYLRRGRSQMTGSRVGSPGNLTVMLPSEGIWMGIPGSLYYHDKFWRPERYHAWIDSVHGAWPKGLVEVGPIDREAPAAATKADQGSRL